MTLIKADGYWARIWDLKKSKFWLGMAKQKWIWPSVNIISKEEIAVLLEENLSKKLLFVCWVKFESREDMDSSVNSFFWGNLISQNVSGETFSDMILFYQKIECLRKDKLLQKWTDCEII